MLRTLKAALPVLVFFACTSFTAIDYTGDVLLSALGLDIKSAEFKPIKDFWLLDKNLQNTYGGIKFSADNKGKIQSIFIAGETIQISGVDFSRYTSPLPLNITWGDDANTLSKKLGTGQAVAGKSSVKYVVGSVTLEVSFGGLANSKISSIKFYNEPKAVGPSIVIVEPKKETDLKSKPIVRTEQKNIASAKVKATPSATEAAISPFKKALLSVFDAYRESNFYSIKNNNRGGSNFWNYQYTYSTKLKIPGEKFNMLYCFPFPTSSLDFVSVLKEADAYDNSFQTTYKDFEKKLMRDFPAEDGWRASCIPNKESKTLSDLEFTNDKYGSIVLDYSKNPRGRYILYLRFLLNAG